MTPLCVEPLTETELKKLKTAGDEEEQVSRQWSPAARPALLEDIEGV